MGSGADESGDDMVVGRTNTSEERTILLADNGDNAPNGYEEDFVLNVSIANDKVLVSTLRGVDGIHAKGTISYPTGGVMGVIPAGNGIIAQGLNGVVGYVHAAARDRNLENSVGAGLLGVGGTASAGVFGNGQNGVVGYEQATPRDLAFEASQKAGVLGRGEIGVSGDGANGPGVFGRGNPGVSGSSTKGPGVLANGETGVYATGNDGAGVHAVSSSEQALILQSKKKAQAWFIPIKLADPSKMVKSTAGELLVTTTGDDSKQRDPVASLWFCTVGGDPSQAVWVKLV